MDIRKQSICEPEPDEEPSDPIPSDFPPVMPSSTPPLALATVSTDDLEPEKYDYPKVLTSDSEVIRPMVKKAHSQRIF